MRCYKHKTVWGIGVSIILICCSSGSVNAIDIRNKDAGYSMICEKSASKNGDISNTTTQNDDIDKSKISYSLLKDSKYLYSWFDEEDLDLYKGYIKLSTNREKKAYYYKNTKVKVLYTEFSNLKINSSKFSLLTNTLNKEIEKRNIKFKKAVKNSKKLAEEAAKDRETDKELENMIAFDYSVSELPLRNDKNMLTIETNYYTYLGGVHPDMYATVASYNPKTGKKITIESIAKNPKDFYNYVKRKLVNYMENDSKQQYVTGNYEELFEDWDHNWWIKDGYLFVGYNTYEISYGAVGPIVIPINISDGMLYLNDYGKLLFK